MKNMKRVIGVLLTVCLLLGLVTVPAVAEEAIVITKQPVNAKVAFGETATFTVEAEGENLTYSWSNWAGYPMDDEAFVGSNTNTLKVKANCELDGLTFTCEIFDGEEYAYSVPVDLTVTGHAEADGYAFDEKSHMSRCEYCGGFYGKEAHVYGDDLICDVCEYTGGGEIHSPVILQEASYRSADYGEDIRFVIKAYGVGLSYQWYRVIGDNSAPSEKLTNGAKYAGTTTRVLTVKAVECVDDDYNYFCIVSNAAGNAITETSCYVIEEYDVKQADAFMHEYRCQKCNEYGGCDSHFDTDSDGACDECEFVFPANAPKLTRQPEDHNDLKNGHETVTYKVTATGENLTYQWFCAGSPLSDDEKFSGTNTNTLTVKSVYDEDAGIYDCQQYFYGGFYCVVSNENGMVGSQSGAYGIEDAGIGDCSYWNEFYHEIYCECGNWIEDVFHEDADHNKICDGCGYKLEDPFKDVTNPKEWYYEAARYGKIEGFFKGSYGNFEPKSNITRGEMVTVLARLGYTQDYIGSMTDYEFEEFLADIALEYGTTPVNFTDVSGKFYERHARILSALGVVNGYANNQFKGGNFITREELATILVRYIDLLDARGVSFDEPIDSFTDADKVSDWAEEYVEAARVMGIFKGDNGKFKPKSNATRAEVAQTLFRMGVYEGMLNYQYY